MHQLHDVYNPHILSILSAQALAPRRVCKIIMYRLYQARTRNILQANWAGFGDYVKQLHDWGMHNILIFDPSIEVDYDTFQRAIDKVSPLCRF